MVDVSSTYNDELIIPESSTGGQDGDGGYTPPTGSGNEVVLDCDIQEPSNKGRTIVVSETGTESVSADLYVFLKDKNRIKDLKVDQNIMLKRNGGERFQANISNTRVVDYMIEVNTI